MVPFSDVYGSFLAGMVRALMRKVWNSYQGGRMCGNLMPLLNGMTTSLESCSCLCIKVVRCGGESAWGDCKQISMNMVNISMSHHLSVTDQDSSKFLSPWEQTGGSSLVRLAGQPGK